MTTPVGLELVWASEGDRTNPEEAKYKLGWLAEIPTFQNFNYVLNAIDSAKLSFAESNIYPWQDLIAYQAGAKVVRNGVIFYCITGHNDLEGTNPQDPELDSTKSYWVNSPVFSSKSSAYSNVIPRQGVLIDQVTGTAGSTNLWEGNSLTLLSKLPTVVFNIEDNNFSNWALANVRGSMVVVKVDNAVDPDSRSLIPTEANKSYRLYHEGFKPKQTDVEGSVEEAPTDGSVYSRQNKNWVKNQPLNSKDYGLITGIVDSETDYGAIL